jgi:hypothetical protein
VRERESIYIERKYYMRVHRERAEKTKRERGKEREMVTNKRLTPVE